MTGKKFFIAAVLGTSLGLCGMANPAMGDYVDAVNALQPTAYWRLNESAGSTAFDSIGGLDGTYHNGVALGQPGINDEDTAVRFWTSQGPGYAEIPHSDDMLLDNGTISFWFEDTGTIRDTGLFSKDSSGYDTGGHLTAYIDPSRVNIRLQSIDHSYFVESEPIQLDTWYNVIFTFGDDGMKLYMDGELVDTNAYTGGLGSTSGGIGNFEPLVLGANSWGSGNQSATPLTNFFSGLIDEVAVFDYAFTDAQAEYLYNAVPEPASLALLGMGSLAVLRRGKR